MRTTVDLDAAMVALDSRRQHGYNRSYEVTMARQYSVAHAKNNLPALIHEAELGSPVEITRHGKPVAVILAFAEYNRMLGDRPDLWESIQRFRAEHDLEELDIDTVYRDIRDPAPGRDFKW